MDVAQSISLVGAGIDTAGKIVGFIKALRGAKPEEIAAANEQMFQVKDALYAAKDTIFALKDTVAEMVERIKELEHRIAQREAHSLTKIGVGAFAYVRSDAGEADKGGPWLCQTCFEAGKYAVFQIQKRDFHVDRYKCPLCGAEIQVPNDIKMEAMAAPRIDRFSDF